jgi:hypothetical protein
MHISGKFIMWVFALILFTTYGINPLIIEHKSIAMTKKEITDQRDVVNKTTPIGYATQDLVVMTGKQIVGMVPYALAGEYILIVDGITINSTTDITTIDLRAVPPLNYRIGIYRDPASQEVTVTATH